MYANAVEDAFGSETDYAMLVKIYGASNDNPESRYSPASCIGCRTGVLAGNPDPKHISTSFVERSNLSMRMGMRRFTRLTNAFSKKLENHGHAVALYFLHYNFCRVHKTLRVTPAMEAGLTDHVWSLDEVDCHCVIFAFSLLLHGVGFENIGKKISALKGGVHYLPFKNAVFAFDKQTIERVLEQAGVYGLFYWNSATHSYHCLYVGQSDNLRRRLAEHYNNPPIAGATHVFAELWSNAQQRLNRESELIREFNPPGNKVGKL